MNKNNYQLDFIGIGAPRSGTTWIYECLKEHPQICMTENEEAGLFDRPYDFKKFYSDNFRHCQSFQLRGEYTPSYLAEPAKLNLIKQKYPQAKLIVCLRNPIDRFYSHFLGHRNTGKISKAKTLSRLLEEEPDHYLIQTGFYASHLEKVFELFPRRNVLVLLTEDIGRNPKKFIQEVYRFLGVNEDFTPQVLNKKIRWGAENPVRSVLLNRAIYSMLEFFHQKSLRSIGVFLKKIKFHKLVNFMVSVNKTPDDLRRPYVKDPMPEEIRRRLREIYGEEIKILEKMINRNLDFWQ